MAEKQEKPKTVSVYRPQGTDPIGATVGGYRFGVVHHGVPEDVAAALVEKKNFAIVEKNFDPKKAVVTKDAPQKGEDKVPAEPPPSDTSTDQTQQNTAKK
jgi:hypothetical protein